MGLPIVSIAFFSENGKKIYKSFYEWITAKIIVENLELRKRWKIEKTEQTRET